MQEGVTLELFTLSIDGLKVRYRSSLGKTTIIFDSFSTCILLQELDIIEAVDIEGNEPVILFTENESYGWCEWCDFVRTFPFKEAEAQKVAEHHFRQNAPANMPAKDNVKSEPLLLRDVTPPLSLYHIHQYYRTNISTSKK